MSASSHGCAPCECGHRRMLIFVTAVVLQACGEMPATRPAIVIDGRFEDWAVRTTDASDPADAPAGEIDLGDVRIVNDAHALYLLIDLGRDVNVQGLDGSLSLLLDTDGESTSGREMAGLDGVDLEIEFSGPDPARPGHSREGVAVRPALRARNGAAESGDWDPAVIGLRFEPRHTSRRIELRIEREPPLPVPTAHLRGDRVRGKLVFVSEDGSLVDETPVFSHVLDDRTATPGARSPGPARISSFERPPTSQLRVVSWNVARASLLRRTDAFARVLRALRPDLVLLDEVPPGATREFLQSFFSRVGAPGGGRGWHVLLGAGGGNQRGVIAARFPVDGVAELAQVTYPRSTLDLLGGARREDFANESWRTLQEVTKNAAGGSVPTVGGLVTRPQGRLVAVTLDLVCCGNRAGSLHDRVRRIEATAIRAAARRTLSSLTPDAMILGGDFNLVGSRDPLDILAAGLDPSGTDLVVADALQLDGVSSATWESSSGPFPPGQLDYVLYSSSSLALLQAFVFDTRDVASDARRAVDLRESDTELASDHLPLVLDFRWREREDR